MFFRQKLTHKQKEKLAEYFFDISKLALGSWVFGFFVFESLFSRIMIGLIGLTFASVFFILGMKLFKEVK